MTVYIVESWGTLNMIDEVLEDYEVHSTLEDALADGACSDEDSFNRAMRLEGAAKIIRVVELEYKEVV